VLVLSQILKELSSTWKIAKTSAAAGRYLAGSTLVCWIKDSGSLELINHRAQPR
jgi:hypothetical protein